MCVKHWDTKDGQRRLECKETGSDIKDVADNCRQVIIDDLMEMSLDWVPGVSPT